MNGKTPDIEQLLRAAARQEPEPASPAEKRQAWEQLRQVLDRPAAPPSRVSRGGWWWLLVEGVILFFAGSLFFFSGGGNVEMQDGKSFQQKGILDDSNPARFDSTESQDVLIVDPSAKESTNNPLSDEKNSRNNPEKINGGKFYGNKKNNGSVPEKADLEKTNDRTAGKPRLQSVSWNDIKYATKKTSPPNALRNDDKNNHDEKQPIHGTKETATNTAAGNNILNDRPDIQPVYPGVPSQKGLSAADRNIQPRAVERNTAKLSPFSLKAAVMATNNQAWAVNFQGEYTLHLPQHFAIRPSIGIIYASGAKNKYGHFYRNVRSRDTVGGTFQYIVDTATTNYTLKSTLHAGFGVQLIYETGRWSVYAGMTYQHQLMQKGIKDSSVTGSYTTPFDTLPHYPAFSANRLPGRNFLQLQAGVDYQLTPVLRVGLQYNSGLKNGLSGEGFTGNIPAYPTRQSFELHIRYFFRKKD